MQELAQKTPFEINTGAVARGYRSSPYPAPDMLEELKKMNGMVIISSDCHAKTQIDFGLADAAEYAKSKGFVSGGFTDKKGILHKQEF